jgi:hypothetical protein
VGWGRFLQRDPNATGLPVQAGLGFHGDGFDASVQGFDLAVHYGDGANVYEYIGSDPLGGSDPTGLMEFSLGGQLATMAINSWDMADGMLETARIGVASGFSLASMIRGYSVFQSVDADWATDWSLSDEASTHSQSFTLGIGPWEDDAAAEADQRDRFVVALRLGGKQDRAKYEDHRSRWSAVRRAMWRAEWEAATKKNENEYGWSKKDLARMEQGLAPEGWTIHHKRPLASGGTNNPRNLVMMPAADHQSNFKDLHRPPYNVPGSKPGPNGRPGFFPGKK